LKNVPKTDPMFRKIWRMTYIQLGINLSRDLFAEEKPTQTLNYHRAWLQMSKNI